MRPPMRISSRGTSSDRRNTVTTRPCGWPPRTCDHAARTCIGRNGALADLVGSALFLCLDAADYVTGQLLHVDGGYTAK